MKDLANSMSRASVTKLDARGLMPLEEARALVAGLEVFERGEVAEIDGTSVLAFDRVWAALCSLENGAEFVRVVEGKEWRHSPRASEATALAERYGNDILPWLQSLVGESNDFPSGGRCPEGLHDNLLALSSVPAAALALRIEQPVEVEGTPFFLRWLARHPQRSDWLWNQAKAGNERAKRMIEAREKALISSPEVQAVLEKAETITMKEGPLLTPTRVQEHFDKSAHAAWDNFSYFCGAIVVTGFADPEGDALVFQALTMDSTYPGLQRSVWRIAAGDRPIRTGVHFTQVAADNAFYDAAGEQITAESVFVPFVDGQVPTTIDVSEMDAAMQEAFAGVDDVQQRVLIRLGQDFRDRVFVADEEVAQLAQLSANAKPLFRFDAFQLPTCVQTAADSLDILAMLEALKARKAITSLPVGGHPLAGLAQALEFR